MFSYRHNSHYFNNNDTNIYIAVKKTSIAALKIKYSIWYWDATNTKTNVADTAKING